MNISHNSTTQKISTLAIKKIKEAKNSEEANKIADVFLGSLNETGVTEDERVLIDLAKEARPPELLDRGSYRHRYHYGGVYQSINLSLFETLASAGDVPLSKAIAKMGVDTLKEVNTWMETTVANQYIGAVYLNGIEEHATNKNDILFANTMKKAIPEKPDEKLSTFIPAIEEMALTTLEKGDMDESSVRKNIIEIGKYLLEKTKGSKQCYEDIKNIIPELLSTIEKTGTPEEKTFVRYALNIDREIKAEDEKDSSDFRNRYQRNSFGKPELKPFLLDERVRRQISSLDTIVAGIQSPIGTIALNTLKNAKEPRLSLVKGFEENTQNKNILNITNIAAKLMPSPLDSEDKVHYADSIRDSLVEMIEKGIDGPVEKNFLEFYKKLDEKEKWPDKRPRGYDESIRYNDKLNAQETILEAILKKGEDPEIKKIASEAIVGKPNKFFGFLSDKADMGEIMNKLLEHVFISDLKKEILQ